MLAVLGLDRRLPGLLADPKSLQLAQALQGPLHLGLGLQGEHRRLQGPDGLLPHFQPLAPLQALLHLLQARLQQLDCLGLELGS